MGILKTRVDDLDGTECALGDVTRDQWRVRIDRGHSAIVGNLATVGRERAYLAEIEAHGVDTLRQVSKVVAFA